MLSVPYDVKETSRGPGAIGAPASNARFRLGLIEEVLNDLEEFESDIGIVGRDCASDTIHSVFYNRHRIFVVVNRQHRLADRNNIRLKELQDEEMIVRTASSTTQKAFDTAATTRGVTVEPVLRLKAGRACAKRSSRGLGIGVISETEFAPHPDLKP